MPDAGYRPHNTAQKIPGVSGKRIPGGSRVRAPSIGGLRTNVPFQSSSSRFREYHRQQVRDSHGLFAGGWGFAWQGLEAADRALWQKNDEIHTNLRKNAERLKDEMVAWAKANAPWEDQTGAARAGLQGIVTWTDKENFTIMIGHGPDIYYGVWLEVRWGGRYAIIQPTIRHFAPLVGGRLTTPT